MESRGEVLVDGMASTSTPTPNTSPGLFSPANAALLQRRDMAKVEDATPLSSPYLHPLSQQMHKVKE